MSWNNESFRDYSYYNRNNPIFRSYNLRIHTIKGINRIGGEVEKYKALLEKDKA